MSSLVNKVAAATTVYNPYKIFQAAQRCMGDPSVVAKVLVELLGDYAGQDVLMASAAGVLALYYGKAGLRLSSMTDFGQFAGELADELGKRDSPEVSSGDDIYIIRSIYYCCMVFLFSTLFTAGRFWVMTTTTCVQSCHATVDVIDFWTHNCTG